jgi:predicted N-acetyltransferase YhbS
MTPIEITEQTADATSAVERLLDRAFGPARRLKTAQRLRDGRLPAEGLAFVAHDGRSLLGTISFWHVRIGYGTESLLLGPMAVEPALRGRGIGVNLIAHGLREAARQGHPSVILVGDDAYYGRFGFQSRLTTGLTLPGPVDRQRLLGLELKPEALIGAQGLVWPSGVIDPACSSRQQAA